MFVAPSLSRELATIFFFSRVAFFSGSVTSLAAGLAFGGLALIGAYQTSVNPHNYHLSLAVAGLLTGVMGYRFANSGKIMPAGLVTILSIAMCCRILCRAFGPQAVSAAPSPKL